MYLTSATRPSKVNSGYRSLTMSIMLFNATWQINILIDQMGQDKTQDNGQVYIQGCMI